MAVVAALALTVSLAACGSDDDAAAAGEGSGAAAAPYDGETINIIVAASPGGGFDTLARTIQPFLREKLGAKIVVTNKDAAGGLIAFNDAATSDVDDNSFCLCQMGPFITSVLQGKTDGLNFDIGKLTYMGNLQGFGSVIVTSKDSKYQTMQDVINSAEPFRFASPGAGSSSDLLWPLLVRALKLNGSEKPITGYPGTSEMALGTLKGDIDGFLSSVGSIAPQLESGELRALLAMDYEGGNVDLGGVTTVEHLPLDADGRQLIDTFVATNQLKRTLVGPPGVAPERVDAFRGALSQIVKDPAFLEKAKAADLEISLIDGGEVSTMIPQLLEPPALFKQILNEVAAA